MSEWTDIIDGIAGHVELLRELGVKTVALDPALFAQRMGAPSAKTAMEVREAPPPAETGIRNVPDIMFISDVPLAGDDLGLLLKMIAAMGYSPAELSITAICPLSAGRAPAPEELRACMGSLRDRIRQTAPKTIVLLGETTVKGIFAGVPNFTTPQLNHWVTVNGRHIMPIRHPSYLRRFPPAKHDAWRALKLVLAQLGRPVPSPAAGG